MLKMLITLREILRFPRYKCERPLRGIVFSKTSRRVEKHLVTSGVAWRPVSNTGAELKNWMLRQPVK